MLTNVTITLIDNVAPKWTRLTLKTILGDCTTPILVHRFNH